jgi:oligoribonuclease NrnB/cAMP/cGMP phosphodiesterase (DHH superfamily)
MSTPLVIYHGNCQDGFTAAWAIWKKFPDFEFYPGKYQETPPDVSGRDVFFVDFSYKRPVILEMAAKANSITILDHHASAEKDLVDLPENVFVIFDMERSGARITWEFFHSKEEVPALVKYVEDRDLWRFKYEETKSLSAYLFSFEYSFAIWDQAVRIMDDLNRRNAAELQGQSILRKQAKDIDELLQNKFRMTIGGTEVWSANLPYTLCSEAGHILSKGEPFAATFYLDGKSAIFSLRSAEDGIDVSEVAKKYGGGGHKHAAGFKVPSPVAWELK